MSTRIVLALAACAAALVCARPAAAQTDTTGTTTSTSVQVEAPKPRARHGDRNLLTADDIAGRHDPDAYELVRALRPGWLRGGRGVSSLHLSNTLVVYRDGMRLGGPEALRDVNLESIREMRFYDAIEATQRWGTDHGAGAIYVTSR
jgi:hypothetical protein